MYKSNILDVTRIENKSLDLIIERFNLNDAISNSFQAIENEIDQSRVRLEYNTVDHNNIILAEAAKARFTK